jgi:hypothetical protein
MTVSPVQCRPSFIGRPAVGEVSPKVSAFSEREIVREFRNALVALYPVLRRLDCLEDDTQPHDDFDEVAQALCHVLVEKTLMWKYGLDTPPRLPPYGFSSWEGTTDGHIEVLRDPPAGNFRFVRFIGDRRFGDEPFNAVDVLEGAGGGLTLPFTPELTFRWQRPG